MKNVGCLYRISSKNNGIYKDDIPLQRISCTEFIEKNEDWELKKEYYEIGVSGFNLSEDKRDALQDIKMDVLSKEIDVLLVFMFDRLGRREDETPFVVQWLIKNGVEVWSVTEGQRKLDSHVDKLLNYITYWQAEGESIKMGNRVKERHEQLMEEGIYLGGGDNFVAFGYELVKSGTFNRRGAERYKLQVNTEQAKVVKEMYMMVYERGYGAIKIANHLNEKGLKTKRGNKWSPSTITDLLNNPIYKGYMTYGKTTRRKDEETRKCSEENWVYSPKMPELEIVPEEIWNAVREHRRARANKKS